MTPAELRAVIAADCPHRLDDYDRHLNGRQPTAAFIRLWRIEHAISSRPRIERRIARLYRRAQKTRSVRRFRRLIAKASRIRHQITKGLE